MNEKVVNGKEAPGEMMTAAEVARRLRISSSCAYALLECGKLAGYRIGKGRGTWRVSEAQLLRYLDEHETGADKKSPRPAPVKLKHLSLD